MATTLDDVTLELMESNQKLGSIRKSINETNEYLELTIDTFSNKISELISFFKGNSLKEAEEKREQNKKDEKLLNAIEGLTPKEKESPAKSKDKSDDSPLPGILSGLAVAIGTIVGVVKAQIEAAKLFTSNFFKLVKIIGTSITGFVKALTPKFIIDAITKASKSFGSTIIKSVSGFDAPIVKRIKKIKNILTVAISNIGMAIRSKLATLFVGLSMQFDVLKMSIMDSKVFKGIAVIVKSFFKPFKELFTMIKGAITTVQTTSTMFANISSNLSKFAGFLGKVIGVVSKIFLPLTIIMTLWDTVKGMIEGFEKEGIIGGLKGAITGMFNSLIFGPLDMIKSAVSWILGLFGFEKMEALLDSFSFEDMFTKIVETIFSPLQYLQDAISGAFKYIGEKFGSVLSFFGVDFGAEDAAKKELEAAREMESDYKTATAIGRNERGDLSASTIISNRGYDKDQEEANENLIKSGYTPLTPEERLALEKSLEAQTKEKEAAFKELKEAPKIADFLPSMDEISENLKGVGTSIWESITGAFDSIVKQIKEVDIVGFIGDVSSMATDFFKNILRGVLPSPDAMIVELPSVDTWFGKIGGGTINLNPIPDSLYEFAGINPATGDAISPPSKKQAEALTQEMEAATSEQNQMKDSQAVTTNVVDASSSNSNITNNTTNNTIVTPAPNPVRQPNSPSDVVWAAASVAP